MLHVPMTLFRSQQETNNEIFGRINSKLEGHTSHHEFLAKEISGLKDELRYLIDMVRTLVPLEEAVVKTKPKKGNKKDRLIDDQK